jgi:very-short-patch-repair endonuclease
MVDWDSFFASGKMEEILAARRESMDQGRDPYFSIEDLSYNNPFDSPIEALVAWAFVCDPRNVSGDDVYLPFEKKGFDLNTASAEFDWFTKDAGNVLLFGPREIFALIPQVSIGRMRADFLLLARHWFGDEKYNGPTRAIVIECDGHDFHERTKEQAARDRRRDRLFQSSRIPLLRFTGSEIWSSPAKCAGEIWELLGNTR